MVYGKTIRLPGEFLQEFPSSKTPAVSEFIQDLHKTIKNLRPQPIQRHGQRAIFEYKDMDHIYNNACLCTTWRPDTCTATNIQRPIWGHTTKRKVLQAKNCRHKTNVLIDLCLQTCLHDSRNRTIKHREDSTEATTPKAANRGKSNQDKKWPSFETYYKVQYTNL